jgi:hypothetical protein
VTCPPKALSARQLAWVIGGFGVLLCCLGWAIDRRAFAFGWLAALATWIGWPIGCLAILFTHTLTGGRWGWTIRPALLAGIGTLPLLLPALVPVALLARVLYPWLDPTVAAGLPNIFYLNPTFAAARWTAFLIIWFGLAALALRAARRGGPGPATAVVGLLLLALSVTFSAYDLLLSLEPHFSSSEFGLLIGAEDALLALAVATGMTAWLAPLPGSAFADLGRLLLGLLVLWAYLDFMQLLIVWQSNLPHEAVWYRHRLTGFWGGVTAVLAFGHFLLPFAALLVPALRRTRRGIGAIAALLIAMAALRGWWLVLPGADRSPDWIACAAMLALGGVSAALALPPGATAVEPRHA